MSLDHAMLLEQLRAERDQTTGLLRQTYNQVCDRLNVLISHLAEDNLDAQPCEFCGFTLESPCESAPPDICEKAINANRGTTVKAPLSNGDDLSAADIMKLAQHGTCSLIREKNATIKAHQSVLAERDATIQDLAQLVRRLASSLVLAHDTSQLPAQAFDYLERKGLRGSPLREGDA